MRRIKSTGWLLLMAVVTACSEETIVHTLDATTDRKLVFAYEKELTVADIDFKPYGIRVSGDTLFVANRAENAHGIYLLNRNTGTLLGSITGWEQNEEQKTFDNQLSDVEVSDDYIFALNQSSRVDIFRRSDLSYVATAGKTGWPEARLMQCESVVLVDDVLYIRNKSDFKAVRVEDCLTNPGNSVKILAANDGGITANNPFGLESVCAHDGEVYVTDYVSKTIFVADIAAIADGKIPFDRSFVLDVIPVGIDFYGDDMYVVCQNNSVRHINPRTGELLNTYTTFGGNRSWGTPGRICFCGDDFYLLGRAGSGIVKGRVEYIEISYTEE